MIAAPEFAEVQSFAAGGGDLEGLLALLRPDALIGDGAAGAEAATEFARAYDLPVVHGVAGALFTRGGPVR